MTLREFAFILAPLLPCALVAALWLRSLVCADLVSRGPAQTVTLDDGTTRPLPFGSPDLAEAVTRGRNPTVTHRHDWAESRGGRLQFGTQFVRIPLRSVDDLQRYNAANRTIINAHAGRADHAYVSTHSIAPFQPPPRPPPLGDPAATDLRWLGLSYRRDSGTLGAQTATTRVFELPYWMPCLALAVVGVHRARRRLHHSDVGGFPLDPP